MGTRTRLAIAVGWIVITVGCSSAPAAERSPDSTLGVPTSSTRPTTVESTTTTVTVTVPSTSTTTAPSTSTTIAEDPAWLDVANQDPIVADETTCTPEWSPLGNIDGEVTFARDGAVFNLDPSTGAVSCLATLDRDVFRLDWNPAGDRLLVDSDLVLTADSQRSSGFESETPGLSWSSPSGTALIAPSDDGSSLVHVDTRDGIVTDVASIETTWAAAYHPSGLAIVSAGVRASDGASGLFIADNTGSEPVALVILDDSRTRITEVAFAPNGNWVVFVHDHSGGTLDPGVRAHIHQLFVPVLSLVDVAEFPETTPGDLLVSEQWDATVSWTTESPAVGRSGFSWTGKAVSNRGPSGALSTPVGFFGGGTMAMIVRPDPDSAGDLFMVPRQGDPVLIARGVTAAATRTAHHPTWSDPPLRIEQQAVG